MKTKSKLKSQLALEYQVSMTTMIKWMKSVPNLNLLPNQRILTPSQIRKIYAQLGSPLNDE